jgi:GNAT superfamily N-acetyltransferase
VSIETLAYEPSRRDEVFDLLARGRGHATDPREFDWWFDGNPVGPRTLVLAEEHGVLAGVLGASFYRTIVEGRETLSALPLWAVTDERFRGRGIFQRLNAEVERVAREAGATIELGFTNRLAGPIYIAKLGWQDVHRLRIWARPLRPSRTPSGAWAHMHTFVAEQENAYGDLAPKLRNHFVRDTAYLNWRYADAPRAYRTLVEADGYAVLGRKEFKGVDAAYVADLVAPTFATTRSLLRRCIRAARGARVLLALMPAVHASAYVSIGFVPTPQTIRLIGHALDGELPLGRRAWHFSLGDTDFF